MESFIADLINNPKVPKTIRYAIVTIISIFIIFIGVGCAIKSPFLCGRIFGIILAITFLGLGIYICINISKS